MKQVEVPEFADYPEFFDVDENLQLFDKLFCYVIDPYPFDGYSLYIGFREDHVIVRLADFKSNDISMDNLDDRAKYIMSKSSLLANALSLMNVVDACFYFSDGLLVDVMTSANKLLGPGMLRDLFSKSVGTQNVVDVVTLDEENRNKYKGKLVKPSRFRYTMEKNVPRPIYGIL